MNGDRPLLGILLMLGFCVTAPLGDGIAKLLSDRIPLLQLVLVRFAIQAALLLPLAGLARRRIWWTARINSLVALRTLLHIAGIGMMFLSLRYLPLADAVAIAFVMPFILLLLGRYVFGETVGSRRVGASVVGFAGTLLVIQPSFTVVGPPALLPVGVALVFALFMLVTRLIARVTDPIAMQAASGLYALVFLLPVSILGARTRVWDLTFLVPQLTDMILLLILGILGTAAHLLMTWSLRFAPASTLAPMQYIEIPFAAVVGWLLFRDLPNGLAAFGIAITVSAGLYVIRREQMASRDAALQSPPPAPPAA